MGASQRWVRCWMLVICGCDDGCDGGCHSKVGAVVNVSNRLVLW